MVDEQKELEDREIIVNEVDGLPSLLDDKNDLYKAVASEQSSLDDLNDEDLPTSLIVTNIDPAIFKDDDLKVVFDCVCRMYIVFIDVIAFAERNRNVVWPIWRGHLRSVFPQLQAFEGQLRYFSIGRERENSNAPNTVL